MPDSPQQPTKPTPAQWRYLGGLAMRLGRPNARSLAAQILGVANPHDLELTAEQARRCIDVARERLRQEAPHQT